MSQLVILQIEQVQALQKDFSVMVVEALREDLSLNFWEEELTVKEVAADLKVSKDTVYNWKGLEQNAIPFQGQPERITRREARAWFTKYSNIYRA
jgi:excisionase family DNA binding protein